MQHDWEVLIRGARVFDGTGATALVEDVAIHDGRIAARGVNLAPERAQSVVEARGRWLLPGLLDIHTHLDLEVELAPGLPESVRHGTTTVVVGNCSLGTCFGRQQSGAQNPIVDCFTRVENIPKSVLNQCVEAVHWDNTGDYLDHFETTPPKSAQPHLLSQKQRHL
jgi:N-acyl-D-aspartate/D-glutamate deacylase